MDDLVRRLRASVRDVETGEPLWDEARPDLYASEVREVIDRIEELEAERDVAEFHALDRGRLSARADLYAAEVEALRKENERLQLFIASDVSRVTGLMASILPRPLSRDDTCEAYLGRISELFTAEADKLKAGIRAALQGETG